VLTEDDDGTIKIGFMYTSDTRSNSLNGAELAALQLNGEGGVHGREIAIIARGNISALEHAAEIAEELITKEGVSAIVGPNRSLYAVAAGAVAQRHGIPMITTGATNPSVTAAGDFVFMAAFTDDFQGKVMAQFAAQDLEAKTAAVLTHEGDVYSEGLSQTFIDNFTAYGGEIVVEQFYTAGDTDFTAQLTAIAEATPDVVFSTGFIPELPLVVRQAREEIGITATFLGGDSWDNPGLIPEAGTAVDGSFFSSPFSVKADPDDLGEDAHRFIIAYTGLFDEAPDGGAALGYDAIRLLVQAIRRAPDLGSTAIRDQIAATSNYSGATLILGYDHNRHTAKSATINRIVNGEVQFYKLIEP
jgi:branched-chain amino acid transport system substrate-binding protein